MSALIHLKKLTHCRIHSNPKDRKTLKMQSDRDSNSFYRPNPNPTISRNCRWGRGAGVKGTAGSAEVGKAGKALPYSSVVETALQNPDLGREGYVEKTDTLRTFK